MHKSVNDSNLQQDSPKPAAAQPAKWATLSIAVSPELKARLDAVAASVGLRPSQYGRMVLLDDIARKTALNEAA